jgi:sulfur carrier protein ThiS
MHITIKLYAMLSRYLPPGAERNVGQLEVPENASVGSVIEQLRLPKELVHLVLVNGVYVRPEQQGTTLLNDSDSLAIWPPVAGG